MPTKTEAVTALRQVLLVAVACLGVALSSRADERELAPGEAIEVRPAAGDTSVFFAMLDAGTFAHLELFPSGVDASLTVEGPGGQVLLQIDDDGMEGSGGGADIASWITSETGRHVFRVHAKSIVARGFFEIRLDARRREPHDEARLRNERRLTQTRRSMALLALTPESEAELLQIGAEARRLGDAGTEAEAFLNLACGGLSDLTRAIEFSLDAAEYGARTGKRSFDLAVSCAANQLSKLGHLDEAIEIQRQLQARRHAADEPFLEIESLCNLGSYLIARGDFAEAGDRLRTAQALATEVGDSYGAAAARGYLGRLHMETGAHQDALDELTEALRIYRELDALGQASSMRSALAEVHYELGDLSAAASAADEVIAVSDRLTVRPTLSAFRTRGLVRLDQRATAAGLGDLEQAVAIARRGGPGFLPRALNGLGRAEMQTGRLEEARRHHEEALRTAEATGQWGDHAEALVGLCAVEESAGRLEEARARCAEALERSTRIELDRGRVAVLYRIARIDRRQGRLAEARDALGRALDLVDARRYRLRRADLRDSYVGTSHELEDEYVDLLVEMAEMEPQAPWANAAFEASEQRRARSLRDMLSSASNAVVEGVDAALLAEDRLLRDRLRRVLARQVGLGTARASPATTALAGEVTRLTAALEEVAGRLRATSPRYAALTQPQPPTLAEIQADVVDGTSAMLFYALGERRSFLWVVTPGALRRYTLPPRRVLERAAARFHRAVAQRADTAPTLAELSRHLLRPVSGQLHRQRLLVIGDGALLYVPFAALPDPRGGGPLIRRHEVVHLPSAAASLALRRAPRTAPGRTVAVLADPVFSAEDVRVAGRERTRRATPTRATVRGPLRRALADVGQPTLWRLAGTRREAEAIRSLAPGDSRLALDFEANRATAVSPDMSSYRFLHFATHGIVNSARPELSGLVLSLVDAKGRPQDGLLTSLDTFNLKLSADVVVLSGCRTALGKQVHGEGIVGLTRGFMYAGARGVLASLWPVDDRATASLMTAFYEGMLGPERLDPPAALRRAQLGLRTDPRWSAPYYWAAFQLQGDWRGAPASTQAR